MTHSIRSVARPRARPGRVDFKVAAGVDITDPDAYAASIAGDYIDQARKELAAEQQPNGHKDCTRCRGKGVLPDWSGWRSTSKDHAPDPRSEPDDEDPAPPKEQILAGYPEGTTIWECRRATPRPARDLPVSDHLPDPPPDTSRGPGFLDNPYDTDPGPATSSRRRRPCFVCESVHPTTRHVPTAGETVTTAARPTVSEKDLDRAVAELAAATGWMRYHTLTSIGSPHGFPDLVLVARPGSSSPSSNPRRGRIRPHQALWLDLLGRVPSIEVYLWRPTRSRTSPDLAPKYRDGPP